MVCLARLRKQRQSGVKIPEHACIILNLCIVHTSAVMTGMKSVSVHALSIYRRPIPILRMEITTSSGALSLFVGSGSGWNSVKQGMFLMVMALQVSTRMEPLLCGNLP